MQTTLLMFPNVIIRRVSVRVGGTKSREVERFIKFALVGVLGTLIDIGLTNILMKFVFHVTPDDKVPALIASAIGFIAAVTSNFLWNRYWTYPDSRSRSLRRQLVYFFLVNLVGLLIRSAIVNWTYHPAVNFVDGFVHTYLPTVHLTQNQIARIGANIPLVGSIAIVMFWNFFVNRHWTYNDVD